MGMREEIQVEMAERSTILTDWPMQLNPWLVFGRWRVSTTLATGTASEVIITYGGRGVLGSYLAKEIDGSLIQTTDEKLLVLQNKLHISEAGLPTAVQAAPAIGDIVNGLRVMNVSADPADATWTVQLRV